MAVKKTINTKGVAGSSAGVFAIIATGGKQYKVSVGDKLNIEKLPGDKKAGDKITFEQVLLTDDGVSTKVGMPNVSGATVEAKLIENGKAKKVEVMKYKAKSRYLKIRGHRQPYAKVEIVSIKQ